CLLLIVLLSAAMVQAAGLGRLTVSSALGQPFKAEIDLIAVKKEERHSLVARVAPQDIFRQANVDYVPLLAMFKASIENRSDGQPYVKITSPQPINEPFLNMLIELNWPSGRLLREYTVLLSPPEIDAHPPATAPSQSNAPASANSAKGEPATVEKPGLPTKSSVTGEKPPLPESASVSKAHTVYGPVKRGDTLARIVQNIVPPTGVSVNQMLVAIHRANRNAFFGNNMHRLKAGPILRVPDGNEIGTITPAEADKEVKMQTVDWNRYKLADVVGLIPATEELRQTVTGKIESDIDAVPAAAQEQPSVLKLSKGAEPWNAGKDADGNDINGKVGAKDVRGVEVSGAQDRLRAMEEDAIARSRSLSEANERVALLEKNIKELQKLLELKNLALADMQKQVEAIEPDSSMSPQPNAEMHTGISPQDGLTPESVLETQVPPLITKADNGEKATVTPPTSVESATEIAKPMRTAEKPGHAADSTPQRPAKSSLFDDVTANIEYFGGALVLLITGIVGVSIMGRPKEAWPDSSNAGMGSSAFDPRLHEKAGLVAASGMGEPSIPPGMDNARQADETDPADKVGAYLNAQDIQTYEILKDTPVAERDGLLISGTLQNSGTAVDLNSSSTPVPPIAISPASSTSLSAEPGLPDISFGLDGTQFAKPNEFVEKNTHWHEIVTKLDLARAYQEMGDKEAAKQVLQEVAREGNGQQQESARLMLAAL
ncbi:MAG: hypothetical protein M3Q16_03115, partial [Pseudomonadota bacterium]|nr:hypothetical protein [Pseudomonadota bacterium]